MYDCMCIISTDTHTAASGNSAVWTCPIGTAVQHLLCVHTYVFVCIHVCVHTTLATMFTHYDYHNNCDWLTWFAGLQNLI